MRVAVDLVAVGEAVAVDARVHSANEEAVEEAVGRGAALADAAGVAHGLAQARAALLFNDRAGDDLHAEGKVDDRRAGLADSGHLLQRGAFAGSGTRA